MGLMTSDKYDYYLFLQFFDSFCQAGIEGMDPDDPVLRELNRVTEENNQVFYISDAILMDMLYVSNGIHKMFGIRPEELTQGYFITTTIPEDIKRHYLARSHLISKAQNLYFQKSGTRIISTNVRARKPEGECYHLLYQAYLTYSKLPYESVFLLLVITDISECVRIHKSFHFYSGEDFRMFRFPDEELLMTGMIFSHTEFELLQLIDEGLSSKEIANKLFRSIYTISTHRTNILKKSGKSNIYDVIRYLKDVGIM
jgi:DNA-binding CsgD family transcriptional regulator